MSKRRGTTGRPGRSGPGGVLLGVVSDTHGRFDPALSRIFRGVDAIVHAGDIGGPEVIAALEAIAPVLAVAGNNDAPGRFPVERRTALAGRQLLVRHVFGELHQLGGPERELIRHLRPDVVIFGHSHRPYRARLGRTLLFNPGSAGPRRFSLPRTAGLLRLGPSRIVARHVPLEAFGGVSEAPPMPPLGGRGRAAARSGTSRPRAGVDAWRAASASRSPAGGGIRPGGRSR